MKGTHFPWAGFFIFLTTLLLISPAQAQYRYPYDWGWGMGPVMMAWGGPIFMFIFWILIIILLVLLIRRLLQSGSTSGGESALDILKKRYARGEINKEEFETKKRDLSA